MLHKVVGFFFMNDFYDELKNDCDVHCVDNLVVCLVEFSGHVGRYIDELRSVHNGYGVGHWNLDERILVEFCLYKELCQIRCLMER